MKINNGFNILPWYDSLEKQNCKKWYAYGQAWPLLCPQGSILPFQFISDTAITISSNIYAISVETGQIIDLGVKPTVTEINRADITYYIVKLVSTSIVNLPIGRYNLRMNTSEGFLYSEELVVINNANECIKVEYWNEDTLKFTSGEINFTDDFHFIFYINSTIGKPEYEFEEELTKRLGYKFIESQTSNKVYKFSFVAPEYICDAMRLIRMCDYIKLTTKFDSYNALSFAYEPKWQEQGDLAAVDVEFDTDCIIQKLESFNRRAKESFYNALLADIDEPVLFSTDTVAQYYTEYTTSGTISGKLIRQLTAISEDELVSSLSSIVLPVDNQSDNSQVAKKAFLSDIVNKLIPKVNLSEYLLKSVWDKVFEIRTDRQGKEYIFGKLPVVTQYGITMYADGGDIDLPSLYTGLPIDGKTLIRDEKGVLMVNPDIELGGGVSNFWDLSGIPSWITNSKPKYSYSEIEGTPDLSVYAQVDTLKAYVTLAGAQTLTGEKNFTGGLKVNGSPIIYDSANKYWKLQGNLVLTGGITMYADDGTLNLPSIYDGLPIDNTTIYWENGVLKAVGSSGGGVADSVAWGNITGKPTWIGSSKPAYSYSEIQGTPDLSVYALKTQIPSLSGYATESWVTKQNYATKATTLSGYGITDAYTKTNVDDLLKAYVTLTGTQTITGEKNFTGGLKVNGSPIVYDATKKYWKLEGDLLVTGGVTMYGNEGTYTPSTIMDAILYDNTTLGINSNGQLYVKGGTSGGGLDITALQNYLTQNSYLNVTEGDNRYLKLSGGTLSSNSRSPLTLKSGSSENHSLLLFNRGSDYWGSIGFNAANSLIFKDTNGANYIIWNGSNFNPSNYLPLSGGTLTGNILLGGTTTNKIGTNIVDTTSWQEFTHQNSHGYIAIGPFNDSVAHIYTDRPSFYFNKELYVNGTKVWNAGNDGSGSTLDADLLDGKHLSDILASNVASATKLQTTRTIWGQSFDGTGNIDGNMLLKGQYVEIVLQGTNSYNTGICFNDYEGNPRWGLSYRGLNAANKDFYIYRYTDDNSYHVAMSLIRSNGNVGIGTASPQQKLHVEGNIWANGDIAAKTKIQSFGNLIVNGNVGIGTENPAYKFHVAGSGYFESYLSIGTASTASLSMNRTSANYITTPTSGYMVFCMGGNGTSVNSSNLVLYTHDVAMAMSGGNVGIGTALNVGHKLAVNGDSVTNNIRTQSIMLGHSDVSSSHVPDRWYYASITYENEGQSPSYLNPALVFKTMNNTYKPGTEVERMRICSNGNLSIGYAGNKGTKLYVDGNILANGGITMYSDQRKKTILNHVELSLKQIAEAPLIEHYYNSDESKTTHVGSIAQYWALMNDWFCKLDSEGYYTMEIQNAALASAISIARELDRYETKTDKAIKTMKKRICELEEEVERLKSA